MNLSGKVILVTGASRGIGRAIATELASKGATIAINYSKDDEGAKATLENVFESGGYGKLFKKDISNYDNCKELMDEVIGTFGKLDVLVNNAGTIRRAPLLEYKDEDWQAVMDINLNSVYYLSQAVAKVMAKQGYGKIINIASMLSFQGGKFVPPYTASKHGVAGITKAFANELADLNIQVNAIAPGYIKTANTAPIRADKARNQEILSRIPAGRWGEVSDLMGTVVFLSSKASDYLNGHILAIDGGWLVR